MHPLTRLLLGLGSVVCLTGFFVGGLSWWLTGDWSPFRLGGLLQEQARRRQALEADLVAIDLCVEGKLSVARKVADGDLTMQDAAMAFRKLHADRDQVLGKKANPDTPQTDEELYRNVVTWVGIVLKDDPGRARMTTARLDVGLGQMCERPTRE